MASSNARKFDFKPREQLDALIDDFERDLDYRLQELRTHLAAYADSILSMTGAGDDQYVCNRLEAILQRKFPDQPGLCEPEGRDLASTPSN